MGKLTLFQGKKIDHRFYEKLCFYQLFQCFFFVQSRHFKAIFTRRTTISAKATILKKTMSKNSSVRFVYLQRNLSCLSSDLPYRSSKTFGASPATELDRHLHQILIHRKGKVGICCIGEDPIIVSWAFDSRILRLHRLDTFDKVSEFALKVCSLRCRFDSY